MKINGERHYLWRAVDHEGEVLESFVTKTRNKKAALKFLKKSMKRHGRPRIFVTDKLRSYGAALRGIGAVQPAACINRNSHHIPRTKTEVRLPSVNPRFLTSGFWINRAHISSSRERISTSN